MLADGRAVVDPLEELTPEERREKELASKCCLCEEKEATRRCGPCGDQFCTDCFLSSHAHGARQKHTWERIGRPICESCVKNFALRWCVQCDEPLCLECWGVVHYTKVCDSRSLLLLLILIPIPILILLLSPSFSALPEKSLT